MKADDPLSGLDALFDDAYLSFHRPWHDEVTDDEFELLMELFAPLPSPCATLVDLGCGDGRLSARFAAAGGLTVTGLDASASMIEAARAAHADVPGVRFEHGAIENLNAAPGPFDLGLSWFTSFGFGPTDDDDRRTLAAISARIRPGGILILETVNRDQHVDPAPRFEVLRDGADLLVDERRFDPHSGRLHVARTIAIAADRLERRFAMRLFTATELVDWLRAAGFGRIALFGDEGEPFALDDGRMIARAEKA